MGASQKKPSPEDASKFELYSLIWLDQSSHNNEDTIKVQQKLRRSINYIKKFDNNNECEEYIRSASLYNRFVLIITDELARQIVPRIEQLQQVYSIYIHCLDGNINHPWATQYLKVSTVLFLLKLILNIVVLD